MSAIRSLQEPILPDSRSEEELIRLVLSGQREYFHELVKPYERRVYVAAFGILQNEADAEEVSQEALLKAFRALSTFRGEARFSTWLLRITLNEARMRLRSRRPEYVSVPIEDEEGREYVPLLMTNWRELPSAILERKEVREQIQTALAALSEEHREILILRDIQGLNILETASVLGITTASVKTRLLRARLRMRDLLAPQFRGLDGSASKHGRKRWF